MNNLSLLSGGLASIASELYSALRDALLNGAARPIRVQIGSEGAGSGFGDAMAVHSFHAVESTCAESPLSIKLVCMAPHNQLPPQQFLGQPLRLQLVTDTGDLRSFSAIVTHAQSAPDDGSGAQPWLIEATDAMSMMREGSNSRIFLRSSVVDIANVILREWMQTLGDTFDFDISGLQLDRYPAREMTIQWNESDSAFLQRLMRKHGIAWAVKSGDGVGPITHKLVLFDSATLLPRNAADTLRYHVASAFMDRDAITLWSPLGRITPGTVVGHTWDYKAQRVAEHLSQSLIDFGERGNAVAESILHARVDAPHWADDGDDYSRMGEQRMQYHEMQAAIVQGASSSRDATVMTRFTVQDRPGVSMGLNNPGYHDDNDDYIFMQVEHWGQNNVPKEHDDWMQTLLAMNGWRLKRPDIGHYHENQRYANSFQAIQATMPIVPRFDPEQDWPKLPPMVGVVVCPDGEEVYCDEYGRVFVQFQGLRAEDHDHASGAGVSGSPADSAPIRVAMPAANPGNGMIQLPRNRDEVLITFIGGDPDKPIITQSIHSPVNVPTSFHGINTLPGNRYLSGNRSQEIFGNQATHLLHDNTPKQTNLQAHADHAYSQLTLGYLTTPRIDGDAKPRGEGVELRTDAAAAVRAAQGLLISAWARLQAAGNHLDVQETLSIMQTGMDLFKSMGEYAAKHQGLALKPEQQQELTRLVDHWQDGRNTKPDEPLQNTPIVAITAPEGITHVTAQSVMSTAGKNIDAVAMHDIQHVAGQQMRMQAAEGMSLFAHNGGIQAIGHKGDVCIQSQNGPTSIEAAQNIEIIAKGNIRILGKQIEFVAQDGSFMQIGSGITSGTNDAIQQHAASFTHDGPTTRAWNMPVDHPAIRPDYGRRIDMHRLFVNQDYDTIEYVVQHKDQSAYYGLLDRTGASYRVPSTKEQPSKILVGNQSTGWEATFFPANTANEANDTDSTDNA